MLNGNHNFYLTMTMKTILLIIHQPTSETELIGQLYFSTCLKTSVEMFKYLLDGYKPFLYSLRISSNA